MNEPHPVPTRRYDEKEVGLLLRRAAELQRASPMVPDPSGLTLRELEEIAAEAGLDTAMLRQAAAELDSGIQPGTAGLGMRLAGAPLRVVLERVAEAVREHSYADLLPLILTAADLAGHASQVGQTFTWTSQDPGNIRQLQVLVASSGGHTRIRLEERYAGLAGAIFGGGLGGIGGGVGGGLGGALGGALGSVTLGLGIPAVLITATYLGCRTMFRRYVTRRQRILERLLQELEERLAPRALESGSHSG
jgi:hypothetical protein